MENQVIYPVVVVYVNGVKCRALLDIGARRSYVSKVLLDQVSLKPCRKETKAIEMLMSTAVKTISVYAVTIQNV